MQKLCFISLAKKDDLMLLNRKSKKEFDINLNADNANGMTPLRKLVKTEKDARILWLSTVLLKLSKIVFSTVSNLHFD